MWHRAVGRGRDLRTHALLRSMGEGAVGPLVSFGALFVLPLGAATLLPDDEFAIWVILSTVTTLSLSLDFGGTAFVMARADSEPRRGLLWRATLMSSLGSIVVGAAAGVAWYPYSSTASAAAFGYLEGLGAIAVATLACCVRGGLTIVAQLALHDRRLGLRNCVIVGQAVMATVVALVIAAGWSSAWGLPVGWLVGSVSMAVLAAVWCARDGLLRRGASVMTRRSTSVMGFVGGRTFATIVGAVLLQSDRWIVGSISTASFLAAYEVAWRLASMPKFLAQNLSTVLGSDAAKLRRADADSDALKKLIDQALGVCGVAVLLASVIFGIAYRFVPALTGKDSIWLIFLAMTIAFSLHGLTAPISTIGVGMEMPNVDVRYLSLVLCGSIAAAVAGLLSSNAVLYIFMNLASLVVGCVWFLSYGRRGIVARCRSGLAT